MKSFESQATESKFFVFFSLISTRRSFPISGSRILKESLLIVKRVENVFFTRLLSQALAQQNKEKHLRLLTAGPPSASVKRVENLRREAFECQVSEKSFFTHLLSQALTPVDKKKGNPHLLTTGPPSVSVERVENLRREVFSCQASGQCFFHSPAFTNPHPTTKEKNNSTLGLSPTSQPGSAGRES